MNRIMAFAAIVVAGSTSTLMVSSTPAATEPAHVGSTPLLFIDEHMVHEMQNLERVVHEGEKAPEPVMEPTAPWEGQRIYVMGTVHYDENEDQFRMWYMARGSAGDNLLYAVSDDGVNWDRPNVGLHEFNGSTDNNILLPDGHSPSVVIEPDGDGGRDYNLMGMRYSPRGYTTATSSDGLQWEGFDDGPAIPGSDNVSITRDPQTGQYLVFNRQYHTVANHRRRSVFLSVSDDFENFSDPRPIFVPDERDDARWVQNPDRQRTEFYNMSAAPYEGHFIGFLTICRFEPTRGRRTAHQSGTDGPIYVELTYSPDGENWTRLEGREPILNPGPAEWDQGMILGLSQPLVHNDEVWVYYTGFNVEHGGPMPPKRSVIGRAKWRMDGFVSLRASGDDRGLVETALLNPEHHELLINADASEGEIVVELVDAEGKVIPGYSFDESLPMSDDALRAPMRWRDHDAVPRNQSFRVRLQVRDSDLYAVRFAQEAERSN